MALKRHGDDTADESPVGRSSSVFCKDNDIDAALFAAHSSRAPGAAR